MGRGITRKRIGLSVLAAGIIGFVLIYFLADLSGHKGPVQDSYGVQMKKPAPKPSAGMKAEPSEEGTGTRKDEEGPVSSGEKMDLAEAEAALEDPDIAKRIQAILSLREQASAEAVGLLARFLNDSEQAVVSEAIDTLGFIGLNSVNEVLKGQVLDILLGKAQDKEFKLRGAALIAGAMLGANDRTFQLIGEYIAEEGDTGTDFAVRALAFLAGPESVPYLFEIITKTKDQEVAKNALAQLAKIGTPEALAAAAEGLSSRRQADQVNSAWALSRKNDDESNAMLLDALSGNELSEAALGVIATSPAAAAVFGEALNQNISKEDKLYYLDVLAMYGISAPGEVRNQLAEAIKPLMNSTDPDIRVAAIQAVGKVGAKEDHSEALAEHFDDGSFLVRGAALESFVQYCSPSTYKPLITLWYDEDEKIRRTAFFFSEMFLNQSDLEALEKATTHSDEFIAKHSELMIKHLSKGGTKG
jgi:HEAT repeat protein